MVWLIPLLWLCTLACGLGQLDYSPAYEVQAIRGSHKLLVVLTDRGARRILPDKATQEALELSNSTSTVDLTDAQIQSLEAAVPVASYTASTPMRLEPLLARAKVLSLQPTWHDMALIPDAFNPSIAHWQGRWLLTHRTGRYHSDIVFTTVNPNTWQIDRDESFRDANCLPPMYTAETRDDARLLVTSSGSLLVAYSFSSSVHLSAPVHQAVVEGIWNVTTNKIDFTNPLYMKLPSDKRTTNHKNWIPLQTETHEIFFIVHLHPLKIIKYNQNTHLIPLKVVFPPIRNAVSAKHLPWDPRYGQQLRGGTNGLRLASGQFLSFFHTAVRIVDRNFYFMGAVLIAGTGISTAQFRLHAMSSHPIIHPDLYQGKSTNQYAGYVVFPMSLMHDPRREGFVLLSLGWQDRDGYVVRFNVTEIVESLVVI